MKSTDCLQTFKPPPPLRVLKNVFSHGLKQFAMLSTLKFHFASLSSSLTTAFFLSARVVMLP